MDKQYIIEQLYRNNNLSNEEKSSREKCNLVIAQCKLIDELQELYQYEINKYTSKYDGDSFDAMTALNNAFEPYLKRKKSGCFYPDKSQNDKYDFFNIIFPAVHIKFQEVFSYEEAKIKVDEVFPKNLKDSYDIEFSISHFYNTKKQTLFELSVKLSYKTYICD